MKTVAKFEFTQLLPIGLALVVLGIGLSYGLEVMGDIRDDQTSQSVEQNATISAIAGVAKIPDKMPLLATVIIASIIIGVLVHYLAGSTSR